MIKCVCVGGGGGEGRVDGWMEENTVGPYMSIRHVRSKILIKV